MGSWELLCLLLIATTAGENLHLMTHAEMLMFYSQSQRTLRNIVALSQFWQNTVQENMLEYPQVYIYYIYFMLGNMLTCTFMFFKPPWPVTRWDKSSLGSPIHTRHHTNEQVSHIKCLKTYFSFFWQINRTSATAQQMERLALKTNTIACDVVTLVCKQELVYVVCVRWSVLSSVSAEFYSCLHRCAALSWRMCFWDY